MSALGLAASMAAAAPPALADDPVVILTSDFEDGTSQGWFGRGAATVEVSTEQSNSGEASLLTTDRADTWHGPGRDMLGIMEAGASYEIEAFVRLADQSATDVHMTVQRTPTDGDTSWDRVVSGVAVTDSDWTRIAGTYTFDSSSNSELQLYLECDDVAASFYLDDVTVTMTTPPPGGGSAETLLVSDFEDGTAQGWGARGPEQVAASQADAHTGEWSLLTTEREENWNGPARDITALVESGKSYRFSLYLKLAPDQEPADLRVSVQVDADGDSDYQTVVGNTTVTADEWVHFASDWTPPAAADAIQVYAESADTLVDFYLDDFELKVLVPPDIEQDIPSLHEVLADNFPIGAAIDARETVGAPAELLTKHFNSITAENHLKPETIQPTEGEFNFEQGDALVEFAEANGMRIYGHTLVWHSQTPDWFFQDAEGNPLTNSAEHRQLALDRMQTHIQAVADHYGDRVWAWDVVNEIIDDSADDGLRRSRWYEIIGPDYVAHAFHFAREAFGPDVKLFINDYNTEFPAKRQAMYTLVEQLLADGVPVDGIGHQLHLNLDRPVSWVNDSIELFQQLPVEQAVTELDVSISESSQESLPAPPADRVIRQGYYYRDLFEVLREHDDVLTSVTVWGLQDGRSWLKTWPIDRPHEAPLLFDDRLQSKPAYWGIVDPASLPHLSQSLNVAKGTITVDGERELQWDLLSDTVLRGSAGTDATHGDGSEDGMTGFQLRWDEDNLYALAMVADATVDAGDRVEFFTDNGQVAVARDGTVSGDATAVVTETDTGFWVEVALPLAQPGEEGAQLAFDLRITDDDSGEQISWSDLNHGQELDSERWGTLTLLEAVRHVDIPQAAVAPQVDGQIDEAWNDAAVIRTEVLVEGSADGAKADARLLWDEERLYVLAEVTDPHLDNTNSDAWEQDSVEIFVNPDNTKSGAYQEHDGQYRVGHDNLQSFGGDPDVVEQKLTSAAAITDSGYLVEASITLDSMTAEAGAFIGLELQVNDATDGARTAVHTWHDPTGQSYQNTSRWGVGRLVEGDEDPGDPGVVCDRVISGFHFGSLTATSGTLCVEEGTTVLGPISVRKGASLVLTGANVLGGVKTQHAETVLVTDSRIAGSVSIQNTSAQVEFSGNKVLGVVKLTSNRTGDTPVVVSGNTLTGLLVCAGNKPAPVHNGVPNTILGLATAQCRAL